MKRSTKPESREDMEAAAASWVARRDAGLTEREAAQFELWSADPLHAQVLARFEMAWSALARPRRTGGTGTIRRELGALDRRRRLHRRAAAGSVVAVLAIFATVWWSKPTPVVATAPSARAVVLLARHQTLPDGSIVESPSDSAFTVDFSGPSRRVRLTRGEAMFAVAKDPKRPFVVEAGGVEVRAVGTAFSVQLETRQVEVFVTEGRVAVDRPSQRSPVGNLSGPPGLENSETVALVEAGSRAVVERATTAATVVAPLEADEAAKRLAWRNPRVEFSGAPLGDVVTIINRYNRVHFVIADPGLADVPLSGLFRADDADAFQRMLEAGFGIETERRGGQILLRKARQQ